MRAAQTAAAMAGVGAISARLIAALRQQRIDCGDDLIDTDAPHAGEVLEATRFQCAALAVPLWANGDGGNLPRIPVLWRVVAAEMEADAGRPNGGCEMNHARVHADQQRGAA
jgi:hypothetical protein